MSVCTACGVTYDMHKPDGTIGLHCPQDSALPAPTADVLHASAGALCGRLDGAVSGCWERGAHPRMTPMSLHDGRELAMVVRDLAWHLREYQETLERERYED